MKRVATAVVLIPLVLLAVLKTPLWVFCLLVGFVALWTTREYLDLSAHYGVQTFRGATYLLVLMSFLLLLGTMETPYAEWWTRALTVTGFIAVVALLSAPFVMLVAGMRREPLASALPGAAFSLFALPYIAVPMLSLVGIRLLPAGEFFLVLLLLVVWAGDIFAYYTGRSMGKHLMSPRISPKKTWEGAAASFVAALVLGGLFSVYAPAIGDFLQRTGLVNRLGTRGLQAPPLWIALAAAAAINVAAQLGDLVESLIKRGAGVKDSGTSLPGHGGMLDRIDALLFAAPVAMLVFLFSYHYFVVPS